MKKFRFFKSPMEELGRMSKREAQGKHRVICSLKELMENGGKFLSEPNSSAARIWLLKVNATLRLYVPEVASDPALSEALSDGGNRETENEQRIERALAALQIAIDFHEHEDKLRDLRHQVWTIIATEYLKSWIFYVPVGIFSAAAGFAILGYVQVKGVKIDVREEAAKAKAQVADQRAEVTKEIMDIGAKAQTLLIDAQKDVDSTFKKQLDQLVESEEKKIAKRADELLEDLIISKTEDINRRLQSAQEDLSKTLASQKDFADAVPKQFEEASNAQKQKIEDAGKHYVDELVHTKTPDLESHLGGMKERLSQAEAGLKALGEELSKLEEREKELKKSMDQTSSATSPPSTQTSNPATAPSSQLGGS